MERPDLKLQEQFKSIGIFVEDKNSFNPKGRALGVIIEVGFPLDTQVESLDFDVVTVNPRGIRTHFTNFSLDVRDDQKILSFHAYQDIPDSIVESIKAHNTYWEVSGLVCTSFVDFCWYVGNESVNKDLIPSVVTKKRPGVESADLGWYLPSRFVDSVINALGKLNEAFLSGTLEDAILYGPIER